MSYRIQYSSPYAAPCKKQSKIRLPLLTVLCFLLFLMLVNTFWPQGAEYMAEKMAALRQSAAVMALDRLAEDLFRGEPLSAAFSEFCYGIRP